MSDGLTPPRPGVLDEEQHRVLIHTPREAAEPIADIWRQENQARADAYARLAEQITGKRITARHDREDDQK